MDYIVHGVAKSRTQLSDFHFHSEQESEMQYLDAISKNDRMICVHFQGKPFNITGIQVDAPTSNAKKLKLNNSMKTYKTL